MKKLISFVCSLVILVASAFSCFASTDSLKDQILSALKSGAHTGVTTLHLPQEYLNQAENYLNSNEINLTEEQTNRILAKINEAKAIIAQTNATSLADIQKDSEKFEKIKAAIEQAVSNAGLKFTYNGGKSITITDSNGKIVFKTSFNGDIQQTAKSNGDNAGQAASGTATSGTAASKNDVIKTTGLGINTTNAAVISSIIGLLVLASGAVIYKNKLYKHE